MKVILSIKKYIGWVWFFEKNIDIRKDYKKLADIPFTFLPKLVFVNENEFDEAVKKYGSVMEDELDIINGRDIDIEWFDDFDYQKKLDAQQ